MNMMMKKYSLKKTLLLLALLIVAVPAFCQMQNTIKLGARPWSDGNLTWNDFQVRHVPADSKKISEIYVFSDTEYDRKKVGNTLFTYVNIDVYIDKLLSWYDPDKADEWQLRYNRIIFDLAQISAKKTQFDLNSTYSPMQNDNSDYYRRLFLSKIDALEMESDGGRDTSVIKRYEDEVRMEFEQINSAEPSIPVESGASWGMGVFWSYEFHTILGAQSQKMGPFNGFGMSIDFRVKDMFIDWAMGAGFSPNLRASGFYYDSKYDYSWREGKSINYFHTNLNIGRQMLNRQYYRLIPYAGIGIAGISQETDIEKEDHKGQYESSGFWGLRVQAGLKTDWKIIHFMDDYFDYAPSDLILRLNLFGAFDHFDTIGNVWSVNVGVSFGLDGYFLKYK